MSSDKNYSVNNNIYKTPPIKIGTGLNRTKLGTGSTPSRPTTKLSSTLTTPSRVNISSSGLTPVSRTNSERYQSAYSRLGVLRNTSSPALNEQVDNDRNVTASETVNITRDIDKKESSKRASVPVFPSPVEGLSSDYTSKSQRSTERSSLYLESRYSTDSAGRREAIFDDIKESGSAEIDKSVDKSIKPNLNLDSKPDTNAQTQSSTTLSPKVFALSQDSNIDRDTNKTTKPTTEGATGQIANSIKSGQDDFNLHNYVIPPRRRHGNKSKGTNDSPKESTVPITGNQGETNPDKTVKRLENVTIDSVVSPPFSSITADNDKRKESVDEADSVPKPMQRTRRRLTKRKMSFKKLEDDEYIGFASLPEQVHRKAVRRGFEFTLMVVGETGLGKSTLINSLFLTDLYKDRKMGKIEERVQKTVELEKKELEIEERGVKLKLTIVDTPGFNDAVNAEESWKPIVNYIDKQFEFYFKAESGLNRKNIHDSRVHCCLYFISPYGHGLRPVDVLVMKKLHHKVNIVPLVAKADMLTKREIKALKEKVLTEIEKHKIQIYQFPDCDSDEDEEFKQQDLELKKAIPFAVVGSNTVVEAGGKKIRGRMYPWGIVEVENPSHCDFVKLRQMLISTHMQDLKDVTCDVHYENYRAEHISEQMTGQQKERGKLKRDSVTNMDKVMDTERLLQEKEAEIKRMQEMLAKMQSQLNQNSPKLNGKVAAV